MWSLGLSWCLVLQCQLAQSVQFEHVQKCSFGQQLWSLPLIALWKRANLSRTRSNSVLFTLMHEPALLTQVSPEVIKWFVLCVSHFSFRPEKLEIGWLMRLNQVTKMLPAELLSYNLYNSSQEGAVQYTFTVMVHYIPGCNLRNSKLSLKIIILI